MRAAAYAAAPYAQLQQPQPQLLLSQPQPPQPQLPNPYPPQLKRIMRISMIQIHELLPHICCSIPPSHPAFKILISGFLCFVR